VEDLAALVEAAGGSAFVVGGSSGAVLALDAAAHGLAVTKVALYEPPFILDASRQVPDDLLQQLTARLDAGRRGEAVAYWMTVLMGVPADQVAGMRQAPFWQGLERLASTLAYDAAIMEGTQTGGPLPRDRWAGLTVPTLVMDGGASPPFMHSAAQALADLLPDGRRRTLAGQTHAVDPVVLADVVAEFFTS
jgi:pimeloyl-ACP methyl ester carboxylesterase